MVLEKGIKKRVVAVLIFILGLGIVASIIGKIVTGSEPAITIQGNLKAAVIYAGEGSAWRDTYSHLEQSLLLNMSVDAIDVGNGDSDFSLYDIIYLDRSIKEASNKKQIQEALVQFTNQGGGLFLENQLWDFFDKDFVGAKGFKKLEGAPKEIEFPEVRHNLKGIQEIIKDFDYIYKDYIDYALFDTYDYGYGIEGTTGEVLAEENGVALYTVNKVGKGYVFFTNPLLPNYFNINGFSMKSTNDLQEYFANTTASSNQLLRSEFAGFLSKEKYGFSVERIFGNYGRPSMAWQLHYEEITGMENNSAQIFAKVCEENLQIPSFTIIRNTYFWFNRHEAVTYLLNEGTDKEPAFVMDEYENAYSSGKHIVSGGEWLFRDAIKDGGSYFVDYPEYDQRAHPFSIDYNKDGFTDIIVGSADGYFYYYQGEKMGDNYETSRPIKLTNSDGRNINVRGHSAPIMTDINGDGIIDLISGSSDGNIYWFSGNGDLTFDSQGILVETGISGQVMPTIGDINGDGIIDLVVGSNEKTIKFYYGNKNSSNLDFVTASNIEIKGLENIEGNWLAPHITDINGDRKEDLVIGTFHGYIGKFIGDGHSFKFDGYIEGKEKNYKGNRYLKFGNNCVPTFVDLDGDGVRDLVVGSLEYGLAYPIDSAYFPFKDNLAQQIRFMKDKGYYVGMHFYTKMNASGEYEENELAMHIAALEKYGIKISDGMGFNQHTWHTSVEGETQTLENGFKAGLLWCSGFKPSGSNAVPESSAETAISIPFLFEDKGSERPIIFNTSTMLYDQNGWGDISAKHDLPVSMYYHCDFAYERPEDIERNVLRASAFAKNYDYNFVTEKQYAKAVAASYNTDISVTIENAGKKGQKIILTPQIKDKTIPLYDESYQKAVGAKIVLGEKCRGWKLNTTSTAWYQKDDVIYAGVGEEVIVNRGRLEGFHLNRSNLPIELTHTRNGVSGISVKFQDGGMMQVEVIGDATTKDKDWIITKSENRDATIFTKFGAADTINIVKTN